MIELGATGDYVRAWQRIVGAKPDGEFGPNTLARVISWQGARDVAPDGVVGPLTRAVLLPGDLIKPYEGCSLRAYDDVQDVPLSKRYIRRVGAVWRRLDGSACLGHPTIGWGRQLYGYQWIESCTQAQADAWFTVDLEETRMPVVRRYVTGDPGRVTAACSFAYNAGTGALTSLAGHGFTEAQWLSYVHNSRGGLELGLVKRRREEWALWSYV